MWLFLSVWTFNFICTLTALLMVWVYEIAAPVSWALVAPSLAFDIWRLATPNDYAEDGPHHPIWHSPNTPLWTFGGICIAILIAAPFFQFSCFPTVNGLLEPYFGVANTRLNAASGICGRRYSNVVYYYFILIPFFTNSTIIYITYICKRSRSFIFNFRNFVPGKEKPQASYAIFFCLIILSLMSSFLSWMILDHVGSRVYVPVESIIFFAMMMIFAFFPTYLIAASCGFYCFNQLKSETTHDNAVQ